MCSSNAFKFRCLWSGNCSKKGGGAAPAVQPECARGVADLGACRVRTEASGAYVSWKRQWRAPGAWGKQEREWKKDTAHFY